MTLKGTLFCLFLYVALVWVGAAYLYSGVKVEQVGLLWTAAGLVAVLALTLLSKIWGWVRTLRARAAANPKPAVKAPMPVSVDEAAIRALFHEAAMELDRLPGHLRKHGAASLSNLRLFLLIGPEGSGKTTTFLNSGLEPHLLAGEAAGSPASLPTRLCNLWLAHDALFLELGGRVFSGDLARWRQVLTAIRSKPVVSRWHQFWKEPQPGFRLDGVVACCDVKHFMAASSPQGRERLDAHSRDWQERLGAVAEVFSVEFPTYLLVTKCDALPYFSEYFRRLPDAEIGQVLGATFSLSEMTPMGGTAPSVEAEAKRLTKSLSAIYQALADRRVLHLVHEPDPAQRPAIYEFPREFKRIRTAAVQFLSSTFRANPLRLSPQLRGYYMSGVSERAAVAVAAAAESGTQWSADRSLSLEATGIFRGEATQIFRPTDPPGLKSTPQGGLTRRWLFVSELFEKLLLAGGPIRQAETPDARVERLRRFAAIAICAVALLACGLFLQSWIGNLELLRATRDVASEQNQGSKPTLAELRSLDELRLQARRLRIYEHDGPPLRLRWGLYTGNRVAAAANELYFRRFQAVLLDRLNGTIVAHLLALPSNPGQDDPYNPVFRYLKTHLMLASVGGCSPEPLFVASALKESEGEIMPGSLSEPNWKSLADKQIDFYAEELSYGNPSRVRVNIAARDHAREYLAKIQGVERTYSVILAGAEKTVSKPQRLGDLSPNYAQVLNGPAEMSGVFSPEGWKYVQSASKKANVSAPDEACVLGQERGLLHEGSASAQVEQGVQRLFLRDYAERWRKFVGGFSVKAYGSPTDAARKLELLSDHKSPLLALLAMTSNETNFRTSVAEPEGFDKVKPVVKKLFPSLAKMGVDGRVASEIRKSTPDGAVSPTNLTQAFQPVHWVVPPGSETWVVADKNGAYIDALAQLGHSMDEIGRSPGTPDQGVFQAAGQNYDKALDAARQIARGFQPLGGAGLDVTVERLLEAPIRQAQRFIVNDPDGAAAAKVNGELRALCARIGSTLHKYPFRLSKEDASLEEVSSTFAPGSGAIWKFQAQCLAEFTAKEGTRWNSKDPAKKPQITPEMLLFLNRVQAISDAFFPSGASQPQFFYTLRPKVDASYKDAVLELDVDGQLHGWTSSIQKQFTWPLPAGSRNAGAIGRIKSGSLSFPFASRGGTWGIFRMMGDAEPRAIGGKTVEWKYVRGGDGRLEEIQPAPVRLEIVEFPGGMDLFNPRFFDGLQCPIKAVQ